MDTVRVMKLFLPSRRHFCVRGFSVLGILLLLVSVSAPLPVLAQVSFGGRVTFQDPICQGPPFVPVAMEFIIAQPLPEGTGAIPVPLMWPLGLVTFQNGPPTHIGQNILGKWWGWFPCILWIWVPCGLSVCPYPIIKGGGGIIIYNGSGL